MQKTRVNKGRKAPRLTKVQLERKVNRLERLLFIEQLKVELAREQWARKCPKGHLRRHDECDLMCEITAIEPMPTPFMEQLPRIPSRQVEHTWLMDTLRPYTQLDRWLDQISWWWRKPWGWLLSAKKVLIARATEGKDFR
jgi:hypothetical protein